MVWIIKNWIIREIFCWIKSVQATFKLYFSHALLNFRFIKSVNTYLLISKNDKKIKKNKQWIKRNKIIITLFRNWNKF